jgi:hypothetical protein
MLTTTLRLGDRQTDPALAYLFQPGQAFLPTANQLAPLPYRYTVG